MIEFSLHHHINISETTIFPHKTQNQIEKKQTRYKPSFDTNFNQYHQKMSLVPHYRPFFAKREFDEKSLKIIDLTL